MALLARPLNCATSTSTRSSAPRAVRAAVHWAATTGVEVDVTLVVPEVVVGATLRWVNMGLTTFSCRTTAPRVDGRIR